MKVIELALGFAFKVAFFLLETMVKALFGIISAIWLALMNRRRTPPRAPQSPLRKAFTPQYPKYSRRGYERR